MLEQDMCVCEEISIPLIATNQFDECLYKETMCVLMETLIKLLHFLHLNSDLQMMPCTLWRNPIAKCPHTM